MSQKKKRRTLVRSDGIPREPYESVKRELRQEVHYACPVPGCGKPLLVFHHFDPTWKEKHHHNPNGMIALCTQCHDKADDRVWTKAELHSFKSSPPKEELIRTTFPWSERSVLYQLGSAYAADNDAGVLSIGGHPMLWEERSKEGRLLFSLNLFDEKGKKVLNVSQNSLSVVTSGISDLIINPSATYLKVWLSERKIGIELQFHRLSVEALKDMMVKNARISIERVGGNPNNLLNGSGSGDLIQDNPSLNFAYGYAANRCLDSDGTIPLVRISRARFYSSGRLVEVFDHNVGYAKGPKIALASSFDNGGFAYAF